MNNAIFRQLFDRETSTYTYLLGDPVAKKALLIDPVLEQIDRDLGILRDLDLELILVLDTHVHADHVTAAGELRKRTGAKTAASGAGAPCVDRLLADGDVLDVGGLQVSVIATPGHTNDSLSYLADGRVFTGDALLIRGNGRTDFQNGDAGALYDSVTLRLFALPDETLVYPGHDYRGHTSSTIGEEKRANPRFKGVSRDAFIAIMRDLDLPPPSRLAEAVARNRACGEP